MSPELPKNLKLGQIRRTAGIVPQSEWARLSRDEKEAADALAWHVVWRCRQEHHPALEGEDCVFLSTKWVKGLLRATGATKTGEKTAAKAIATMQAKGWMVDTGKTKKPRRGERSTAKAGKFQPHGEVELEGGKDAQPTRSQHSYWWRIFRVPALSRAIKALKPLGAYGQLSDVPQAVASLSAFLIRQGLISRPKRRSRPNPGSVQWVFLHSGPP